MQFLQKANKLSEAASRHGSAARSSCRSVLLGGRRGAVLRDRSCPLAQELAEFVVQGISSDVEAVRLRLFLIGSHRLRRLDEAGLQLL